MTFEEMLDQALAMLQRRGRMTSRTLKRQFEIDDATLEDLKDELLFTRIGNLKGIFTPPLPPLASGPPAPAAAARAQRWRLPQHAAKPCRGGARSRQPAEAGGHERLRGSPGSRALGRPVRKIWGGSSIW